MMAALPLAAPATLDGRPDGKKDGWVYKYPPGSGIFCLFEPEGDIKYSPRFSSFDLSKLTKTIVFPSLDHSGIALVTPGLVNTCSAPVLILRQTTLQSTPPK
jgi:hypothetical protein